MANEIFWAGLDLGQRQTHVCVIDDAGSAVREEICETSVGAITKALGVTDGQRLGLIAAEASSDTHIVRKLREFGLPVAIFEARKSSRFLAIRRNKLATSATVLVIL